MKTALHSKGHNYLIGSHARQGGFKVGQLCDSTTVIKDPSYFLFPLRSTSGEWVLYDFPCTAIGRWLSRLQTSLCDIQKSEKMTPNLGQPFTSRNPFHSPIPQTSLGVLSGVTGPSLTHKRTRTTTVRIVGVHLWAGRGSPDSECTLLLIPKQSHGSISKNKG